MERASQSDFDSYQSRSRFANLDGLRFVCILMVLWHHAPAIGFDVAQIVGRGFLGVDFFFVLSGFLITTLLLRERDRFGRFSLSDFYRRRILRILPVYVFVVLLVAAYYILVKGQSELAALVPFYLLFLSNFLTEHIPTLSITWSLSVEEQFYMLWPLALLLLPGRLILPLLSALVALNVLAGAGLLGIEAPQWGYLIFKLPTATYAPILMGAGLAMILHSPTGFAKASRLLGMKATALFGFLALLAAIALTPFDVNGWPNLLIHSLMTTCLAALVVREDNWGLHWLQNRWIARVGVVSYGIYLYHLLALDVTLRLFGRLGLENSWLVFLAYSLLSWLVAEASFRTLEAYFSRFRPKPKAPIAPNGQPNPSSGASV